MAGIASLALLFSVSAAPAFSQAAGTPATDTASVPQVKCVVGLDQFKPNTTGTVAVQGDSVSFEKGKKKGEIKVSQIQDIFLGNESRQDVSGLGGTAMKAAIPYGGGRILSLFSHKVEVMTLLFNDADGGFHGAIFVFPEGHATAFKALLVARGAKVTQHVEPPAPTEDKQ